MNGTPGFDVRTYMREPYDLRPADLRPEALAHLAPAALDVLAHLWSAERGLLERMRDFLLTPAHADPRVTAFLTTWMYEQRWLAETLGAVLTAHGCGPRAPADTVRGQVLRGWDERGRPTVDAVRSNLLGADVTGAQMVVSRLDCAVLALAHRRLGELEPRLADTARAVVRVKERHLAFYGVEAAARLSGSEGSRRLARAAVARWSWPGTRYSGSAPAATAARHLFAGAAAHGAVLELDRDIAALPGLAGARPVHTALVRLQRGGVAGNPGPAA